MKLDPQTPCILTWKHAREGIMLRIGPLHKLWKLYRAIKDNDNKHFDLRIFETDEEIDLKHLEAEYQRRKDEADRLVRHRYPHAN